MLLSATSAWAAPPDDEDPEAVAADPDPEAVATDADADALTPTTELAQPAANEPVADEPAADDDDDRVPGEAGKQKPRDKKVQLPVIVGDKHSITYTSMLGARINPLGLEERLWIGYQYRLYNKDKTILNGSNLGLFFRPVVSPAVALIGATLQFQPAAVLRLRATYSYVAYFGTFQFFQSFQSPHDDFSETRLDTMKDRGQNYQTTGTQIELEALIQARYKSLVFRSATAANYNMMNMRGDDTVFYAVRQDALVANYGWVLYNDTDLLWMQSLKNERHSQLLVGARASIVMPFYSDKHYQLGDEMINPNGPQVRVGPALGYVFYDLPERNPRFNRPTILAMPQWNVQHRWRTGRDVSTAMPTIGLAFVFTGQLWGKN